MGEGRSEYGCGFYHIDLCLELSEVGFVMSQQSSKQQQKAGMDMDGRNGQGAGQEGHFETNTWQFLFWSGERLHLALDFIHRM